MESHVIWGLLTAHKGIGDKICFLSKDIHDSQEFVQWRNVRRFHNRHQEWALEHLTAPELGIWLRQKPYLTDYILDRIFKSKKADAFYWLLSNSCKKFNILRIALKCNSYRCYDLLEWIIDDLGYLDRLRGYCDCLFDVAVINDDLDRLKWIAKKFDLRGRDVIDGEFIALLIAVEGGFPDIVRWLIETFDYQKEDILRDDRLILRAARNNTEIVAYLTNKFDFSIQSITFNHGPLHSKLQFAPTSTQGQSLCLQYLPGHK